MIRNFDDLIVAVKEKPAKKIAVVSPDGSTVIQLIKKALEEKIAEFILVGDREKLQTMCADEGVSLANMEVIDKKNNKEAAEEAVRLVVEGKASAIMKGNLPTATFMRAILDKQKGLNDNKIMSELTIFENMGGSTGEGFLILTDCAINIQPTLDEKKQIIENAVGFAHKLGNSMPKVAVVSAVEVVNPAMPDTVEAAALSKMAERGQIPGCLIEGPLAFDNAVSKDAADYKKVGGGVAGEADILLLPNLLTANPLRKGLAYYTKRRIAVALLGAKAPVVMTSRSDSAETMLLTIALAAHIS